MSTDSVSRRNFLRNSLAVGGTVAAGAISAEAATTTRPTQHWDKEADVVVVGYGGAGAVTAITASEAGASVILLEKHAEPGGNTGCSSGNVRAHSNPAQHADFLMAIGLGETSTEMAHTWADTAALVEPWLRSHGAKFVVNKVNARFKGAFKDAFPNAETPDLNITMAREDKQQGSGKDLFEFLSARVKKCRNVEVMLETPAYRLIQDPVSKAILGVRAKNGGKELRIRARKGVVLSLGGFQANRQMMADYVQQAPSRIVPAGTPHNTGDGIKMALEVGADLWHMENVEWGMFGFKPAELPAAFWIDPRGRSHIVVNKDGSRFLDESTTYNHAKKPLEVFFFDEKKNRFPNHPWFLVFDEKARKAGPVIMVNRGAVTAPFSTWNLSHTLHAWSPDNSKEIELGWIKKGDTVEDLAKTLAIDPAGLRKQIETYNQSAKSGKDEAFERTAPLAALDQGPFYGMELAVSIINTEGGPRRNAKSQILNPFGEVIPGLYGAGEFGSMFSLLFPGGHLTECFVSGLLAGRSILNLS